MPLRGKSLNSLARLNAAAERALKRQIREDGAEKRAEWAQSESPTLREKRSLRRGRRRRDKNVVLNLTARKAHYTRPVSNLEQRTQKRKFLINRLRKNIMQDDISLLVTEKSTDDKAKACPARGNEASDTGPVSTSAMLPDAQRLRLTLQATVTVEMLQRVCDQENAEGTIEPIETSSTWSLASSTTSSSRRAVGGRA